MRLSGELGLASSSLHRRARLRLWRHSGPKDKVLGMDMAENSLQMTQCWGNACLHERREAVSLGLGGVGLSKSPQRVRYRPDPTYRPIIEKWEARVPGSPVSRWQS